MSAERSATISVTTLGVISPASGCLNDLRTFDTQIQTDGYWLGGSGFGCGYPVWCFAICEGFVPERPAVVGGADYTSVRSGYDIWVLMAAANVQAQNCQQQPCEATLGTARGLYMEYARGFAMPLSPGLTLAGGKPGRSPAPCRLPVVGHPTDRTRLSTPMCAMPATLRCGAHMT